MSEPGEVTDELVEYLRGIGASDDLVSFADKHVARYSEVDMDRARHSAVVWTLMALGAALLFLAIVQSLI